MARAPTTTPRRRPSARPAGSGRLHDGVPASAPAADTAGALRTAGIAPTKPRRQVLDQLGWRERPATAGELFAELRIAGTRVGLSTVYRTLHALAAVAVVHVFDHDGEAAYRRCSPRHHHHLLCRSCALVIECTADLIERWIESVRAEHDFIPESHHADVLGICGACRHDS